MKDVRKSDKKQSKLSNTNLPRPEIRDNLDSRERKDAGHKDHNNKQGRKPNSRDKNDAGN